ncbi:MAG: PfkB family carbohydrate kinase [Acidimicrobiia bacterium]|nr:PfkB family carbohydrate kinase [Acidimicrobiia bacterium]
MLVACLGACHTDATAVTDGPVVLGTSNPATVSRRPGGVATNVARTLAALEVPVLLAGLVGDDGPGAELRRTLEDEGVDITALRTGPGATAGYTALVDGDGRLVVGIADMDRSEALDASWVEAVLPTVERADLWVVDANLSADGLAAVVAAAGDRPVLADPVSVTKAGRLVPHLGAVAAVFPDRGELEALGGRGDPVETAGGLARGCGATVVATLGRDGIVVADPDPALHPAIEPDRVVDPTGAGDAFLAGWVAGLAGLGDPIRLGLALGSLVVESVGTVPSGIDRARVDERVARAGH